MRKWISCRAETESANDQSDLFINDYFLLDELCRLANAGQGPVIRCRQMYERLRRQLPYGGRKRPPGMSSAQVSDCGLRKAAVALIVDCLKMLRKLGCDTPDLVELLRICVVRSADVGQEKMD